MLYLQDGKESHLENTHRYVPLRDSHESLWSEGTLCVDPQTLALGAVLIDWQLAGDRQLMAKLALARTKLAKQLEKMPVLNRKQDNSRASVMLLVSIPPERILSSS